MRKILALIAGVSLVFLLKGFVLADYYHRKFGDMDSSHDNYVDWDEYRFYFLYAKPKDFKEVDEDEDGKIGLYEWLTFHEKKDPTYKLKRPYPYRNDYHPWYHGRDRHYSPFNHHHYRHSHWERHRHRHGYGHYGWGFAAGIHH